jgi:Icc-related predicted phosphoesterase
MRIICVADSHTKYKNINIPDGDIFIHAGDIDIYNQVDLVDFNDWLGELHFKHRIIVAGNHDLFLEVLGSKEIKKRLTNGIYLENEELIIDNIHFWASPYTPIFGNWAFMRHESDLAKIWLQMSKKCDILITHGPPYEILDKTISEKHAGSISLLLRVAKIKPKYHIFGHIHEGYGYFHKYHTIFVNCSVMDDMYNLVNQPQVIEI